jgi:hypothetical protein
LIFAHDCIYYKDVRESIAASKFQLCLGTALTFPHCDGEYQFPDEEGYASVQNGMLHMRTYEKSQGLRYPSKYSYDHPNFTIDP